MTDDDTRICARCHRTFTRSEDDRPGPWARRRYCSDTCKIAANNALRSARPFTGPKPRTAIDVSWHVLAACRDEDPELFFGADLARGVTEDKRVQEAKAVCRHCPVKADCRRHALSLPEKYGVFGGLSEGEREAILKHRKAKQAAS